MATYDLFISYADDDRAWVEGYLIPSLDQAEVKYFSEAAFELGRPKLQEFERAISQSERTLLVLSPAYLADNLNQFVDLLAHRFGIETATWPVIPLVLKHVTLPPRLETLVGLDFIDPASRDSEIKRLCDALNYPTPGTTPIPDCPYPGMLPFTENESAYFFGRDQDIQEILDQLRKSHFVTLIGPSGSGKSSLVVAGLLPALQQSRLFGSGDWITHILRPGALPFSNLKAVLNNTSLIDLENTVNNLITDHPTAEKLLLVVDQFEELFTNSEVDRPLNFEEQRQYQLMLQRIREFPKCYLILTVRADFYPDLMECLLWPQIRNHLFDILPLNDDNLRQAIIKPAEKVGVFIESALVERLVADAAGEPGILPLIQETLVLLWQGVERRYLSLQAYEALVLSRKTYGYTFQHSLTGLQVAIARQADAAMRELIDKRQEDIARRIFLRLIQFGIGRANTRRQQSVEELKGVDEDQLLFDQTLHHLANFRLLTLGGKKEESTQTVDIAHEALITGWPHLQTWLSEYQEAEKSRRRLSEKAMEWKRLGQGIGGLLDTYEMAEADRWQKQSDSHNLGHDQTLVSFISASRQSIQQAEQSEFKQLKKAQRFQNLIALSTVFILGLTALNFWQRIQSNKAIEAVFLGDNTPEILDNLNKLYRQANSYRQKVDTLPRIEVESGLSDLEQVEQAEQAVKFYNQHQLKLNRAFAYYRVILTTVYRLYPKVDKAEQIKLDKIAKKAEQSLAALLSKYRIPQLVLDLQKDKPNFGKVIPDKSLEDFELRYTPGALKTTYEILLSDTGVGADINSDRYIRSEEALLLPCDLLDKIEELWRDATNQTCGWFGKNGHYEDLDCTVFITDPNASLTKVNNTGPTLYLSIFDLNGEGVVGRLNECGISQR